jgi:hypothetical protein
LSDLVNQGGGLEDGPNGQEVDRLTGGLLK